MEFAVSTQVWLYLDYSLVVVFFWIPHDPSSVCSLIYLEHSFQVQSHSDLLGIIVQGPQWRFTFQLNAERIS